ncbi:hypothetical protein ACFQE5_01825 [Pseudonocardia hispaniensis]|uniref:Head-tail joining protein n=1 Tax=Pseudonocardia hispaniensis TaxID=904933 RepID=A0ABW1IWU6_9PSEU
MFFHDTVTVVRPARTVDRYRNEVLDWGPAATRVQVARVAVLPAVQAEAETAVRDTVTTGWRLYSQPGTDLDIRASDRIEWAGYTLSVVGEPARWPDPITGRVHHVDCALQEVTG